jgi:hypothetical protein
MCGSPEVTIENDLLICQSCGTKYLLDHKKNKAQPSPSGIIVNNSVINFNVNNQACGKNIPFKPFRETDHFSEEFILNLKNARLAKANGDTKLAQKYYAAAAKDCFYKHWEPVFYVFYFKFLMSGSRLKADEGTESLIKVVRNIEINLSENEKLEALTEVSKGIKTLSGKINNSSTSFDAIEAAKINSSFSDILAVTFGETGPAENLLTEHYKLAAAILIKTNYGLGADREKDYVKSLISKIKIHDPDYKKPKPDIGFGGYLLRIYLLGLLIRFLVFYFTDHGFLFSLLALFWPIEAIGRILINLFS